MWSRALELFSKSFDVHVALTSLVSSHSTIGTVKWFKCDTDVPDGVECGTIDVPLDYFNASKGTSTLALARLNATKERRGTVFLNPGGPGGAGTRLVTGRGDLFALLVGPHYDLIGFDPRGIGRTVPKTQCFPDAMYRQIFQANTVIEQGFTVTSNYSDPIMRDKLIEQHRQFLALYETQAKLCAENMGEELKYMGTANVVRDIDFMTTVFDGKNANINFWGGSYGTLLGAYLVNMIPSRVGRVVIDGVANPVVWSNEETYFWPRDFLSSTEDTFQWFLRTCSQAGPKLCPLAREVGEPTTDIQTRLEAFMDKLYETPLPVPNARRPGYLTSGGFRALILVFLERPAIWGVGSKFLAEAMAGDGTALYNLLLPDYDITAPDSDLARLAVSCLDAPRSKTQAEFPTPEMMTDVALEAIRDVSPHFGASMSWGEPDGGCQFWPVEGPERFIGPWNHTLSNKILIISNTADPVTPIASGKLVHKLLADSSALLVQNSPGHCSLALGSLCTLKTVQKYYDSGELPSEGTICETDEVPFPDPLNGVSVFSDKSKDDVALLLAAMGIRDELHSMRGRHISGFY
ncbi:alpha/beta-hydrolase [Schizopora paradoxa]|uniref:Alpha/beta-hydrolase n=1 Tax=Schizopora paradoxa TaxID=27342 RepID=A0A0H2RFH1_9AGAM|nr:alpha/beta-hydrolase [Schizopora paradoxa]